MGNVCIGSCRTSKDGFFQSISNSFWWSKTTKEVLNHTNKEVISGSKSVNKEAETFTSVQKSPPEPVKIVKDEFKPPEPTKVKEETKQVQPSSCNNVEFKPSSGQKAEPRRAHSRKPHNVKRLLSAGLRKESVLQTKTGNLKDYYSLGRKLGHGQFGTTFLCLEKGTGKEYACKSIAKRKLISDEDVNDVRREIQIMHHLSGHANVVSIKEAYEDSVAVHVVMELCAGGELFDRIIQKGHYTERKAAELTKTIVGFIEACHALGVMHRDLKPENFLFVSEEEDSPLKAIDFGLSVFFKPGTYPHFALAP